MEHSNKGTETTYYSRVERGCLNKMRFPVEWSPWVAFRAGLVKEREEQSAKSTRYPPSFKGSYSGTWTGSKGTGQKMKDRRFISVGLFQQERDTMSTYTSITEDSGNTKPISKCGRVISVGDKIYYTDRGKRYYGTVCKITTSEFRYGEEFRVWCKGWFELGKAPHNLRDFYPTHMPAGECYLASAPKDEEYEDMLI